MMTAVEINNSVLVSVLKYWHRIYEVNLVFFARLDDDLKCLKAMQFFLKKGKKGHSRCYWITNLGSPF